MNSLFQIRNKLNSNIKDCFIEAFSGGSKANNSILNKMEKCEEDY